MGSRLADEVAQGCAVKILSNFCGHGNLGGRRLRAGLKAQLLTRGAAFDNGVRLDCDGQITQCPRSLDLPPDLDMPRVSVRSSRRANSQVLVRKFNGSADRRTGARRSVIAQPESNGPSFWVSRGLASPGLHMGFTWLHWLLGCIWRAWPQFHSLSLSVDRSHAMVFDRSPSPFPFS